MKWYLAGAVGAAVLFAAACSDTKEMTAPVQRVGLPEAASPEANVPVTGAAFTTTNPTAVDPDNPVPDGTGHCKNGNEAVNCNIYDGKKYVWLNGGPSVAYVGDGEYFFAVLAPGGQGGNQDPNDGTPKNLSDATPDDRPGTGTGDAYTNRTFTVTGGSVAYNGTHDFAANKIRLMPYDDTPNPGGVYILAICSLAKGYPVTPSACKYDAFKVREGDPEGGKLEAPTLIKDATATYEVEYKWTIAKDVDKTLIQKNGGTATFNYTVTVSHDDGTILTNSYKVTGKITVFNINDEDVKVTVTDKVTDGTTETTCSVTDGVDAIISNGSTEFPYECTLPGPPAGPLTNTAYLTWGEQLIDDKTLDAGDDQYAFGPFTPGLGDNPTDECVNVTDSYKGTLGTVCVGDPNPKTFTYSRDVPVPSDQCVDYYNTAKFTTNDTYTKGSASKTVTVCGATGGLTMGFWSNSNGQGLIKTYSSAALRDYLRTFNAFKDLSSSANGSQVASYVANIIAAAKCSDSDQTCNSMLRAQMLATALSVFYTGPGYTSSQSGGTKPPSNFMGNISLGGIKIDITPYSSVFGGATALTVQQALAYQNIVTTGPAATPWTIWYGQIKAQQVLAKNLFDAINNRKVFVAP